MKDITTTPPASGQDAEITHAINVLCAKLKEIAPLFPEIKDLRFLSVNNPEVTLFGYIDDSYNSVHASGATVTEAMSKLRAKIKTRAQELREQAAKLLADAELLQPSPSHQPAGL